MSAQEIVKPPLWFWIVAGLALVWNLIGVFSYISTVSMTEEALAAMSEAEAGLYRNAPAWTTGAFAIGVFGGVLGSLFLIMRKSWAVPAFILSLIAVIVQFSYWLFMTQAVAVHGVMNAAMMPITITLTAAALIWFSKTAKGRGWLV